jgi:hypothetical protein
MIEEMEIKMRNLLQEVGFLCDARLPDAISSVPYRSISVKPVILCTTYGVWTISQRPGSNESCRRSWLGLLSGDVRGCNARRILKRYIVVIHVISKLLGSRGTVVSKRIKSKSQEKPKSKFC